MSVQHLFSLILTAISFCTILLAVLVVLMIVNQGHLTESHEKRYQSYLLVDGQWHCLTGLAATETR
jgi:hypothetical protein